MDRLKLDDQPFDPPSGPQPRAARPKDAATLVLVRGGREVMMGQRAAGHVFMPDKWVFPGGKVDPGDARAAAETELAPETEAFLRHGGVRRAPRAFALAAARETREETGLQVGGPRGPKLCQLAFVCRAITPPYRPRRFDARFFLADAASVLADDAPRGGDELLHVRWFSFDEAEKLDLPSITRFVLKEVRERQEGIATRPAFLRWRRGDHALERL
jgi:8-oxo-dGTP pyrophosphatase MutT (NUDIX family)